MPRFTTRQLMVITAICALVFAVVLYQPRIIEELASPAPVKSWSSSGLLLADGRTIPVPEIQTLPGSSLALADAIRHGVELSNGRVYTLVRIHHWCGNDRVKFHLARVDLSYMLVFLQEGVPKGTISPELQARMPAKGGRFTTSGWEIGEYGQFRGWCRRADEQGGPF